LAVVSRHFASKLNRWRLGLGSEVLDHSNDDGGYRPADAAGHYLTHDGLYI
jgi:hypothetical protein